MQDEFGSFWSSGNKNEFVMCIDHTRIRKLVINSINNNRSARCNIDFSLHILEVMEGILIAAETQKIYSLESNCNQPKLLTEDEINKLKNHSIDSKI